MRFLQNQAPRTGMQGSHLGEQSFHDFGMEAPELFDIAEIKSGFDTERAPRLTVGNEQVAQILRLSDQRVRRGRLAKQALDQGGATALAAADEHTWLNRRFAGLRNLLHVRPHIRGPLCQ